MYRAICVSFLKNLNRFPVTFKHHVIYIYRKNVINVI